MRCSLDSPEHIGVIGHLSEGRENIWCRKINLKSSQRVPEKTSSCANVFTRWCRAMRRWLYMMSVLYYSLLGCWSCSVHADERASSISTVSLCIKKRSYLRHPLGRHKAGGLDHRQACSWQHVYQLDFDPCWDYFLGKIESEKTLDLIPLKMGGTTGRHLFGSLRHAACKFHQRLLWHAESCLIYLGSIKTIQYS